MEDRGRHVENVVWRIRSPWQGRVVFLRRYTRNLMWSWNVDAIRASLGWKDGKDLSGRRKGTWICWNEGFSGDIFNISPEIIPFFLKFLSFYILGNSPPNILKKTNQTSGCIFLVASLGIQYHRFNAPWGWSLYRWWSYPDFQILPYGFKNLRTSLFSMIWERFAPLKKLNMSIIIYIIAYIKTRF